MLPDFQYFFTNDRHNNTIHSIVPDKKWPANLLDMLFPPFCIGCGQPGRHICGECARTRLLTPNHECFICRNYSPGSRTHAACLPRTVIRRIIICWTYNAFAKKIMQAIKERFRFGLIKPLAALAVPLIARVVSPDTLLVPVPSPKSRMSHRGFSHTALLAGELSRITGARVYSVLSCVSEIRQTGKSRQERMLADRDRYSVSDSPDKTLHEKGGLSVFERPVMLVDDVCTTGSTLCASASALWNAGYRDISATALFRGKKRNGR